MIRQDKLTEFLQVVDTHFPVPLSEKVDLAEYSRKLIERADLVADISEKGDILALAAGYIRNAENGMAYIAIVATLSEVRGQGKAGHVVRQFMSKCREHHRKGVHLYAVASNIAAVRVYEKLGFETYQIENEPRPDDLHLVYWFNKEDRE